MEGLGTITKGITRMKGVIFAKGARIIILGGIVKAIWLLVVLVAN